MRLRAILTAAVLVTPLSGQAFGQMASTAPSVATTASIPVRMVPRQEFCNRLSQGLQQFSMASGFDAKESGLIATAASEDLVVAFKTGRATDYINPEALALFAGPGTKPKAIGYIPMANFLGPALGIEASQTVLALSAAELRFIPHVQQGMNIVVIAQNAAPLTPERAKAVAETAAKLKVRIHVLWVGEVIKTASADAPASVIAESQAMAFLAAVTGGSFADLSGTDNCGRSL